eukprot:CAMPEP_0116892640 /NCGR_PEP_ID=MMETSP0467-20121206/2814_1 /TAXON_ID=283647 /ORGANISM="Mesodinium pulex, Strain SPMC105" /LENGTH=111 /DNA_ID=CAMNT_0004561873 /DNA_START=1059 /DNA_END=1394 /DNA_ORIENTATION=+
MVDFNIPEFKNVSDLSKDLILKLTEKNPEDRISLNKALEHPWFQHEGEEYELQIISNLTKRLSRMTNQADYEMELKNSELSELVNFKTKTLLGKMMGKFLWNIHELPKWTK